MKAPLDLINEYSTKIYSKYKKDPGGMLVITGTLFWVFSAFAQVGAILINDKIPKNQKKFLIPQEIADAGINIAAFYLFTNTCNKVASKLVSTGKLSYKPIKDYIEKKIPNAEIGKFSTKIDDLIAATPELIRIKKPYNQFKNGVCVAVNVVASVIACNIVTPYLRNHLGAKAQKISIEKAAHPTTLPAQNTPILPRIHVQNRIGIDDYKKQATVKAIYPNTSSSMRI